MDLKTSHRWILAGKLVLVLAGINAAQVPLPPFDEVSIVQSKDTRPARKIEPTGLRYTATPLAEVVGWAYETPVHRIEHGSHWPTLETRYDITLRIDHAVSDSELRARVQTLLADRFQLLVKHGSKKETIYRLVVRKNGPKFQTFPAAGVNDKYPRVVRHEFRSASMAKFAKFMESLTGYPVLDETGLEGAYDFDLVARTAFRDSRDWDDVPPEISALKQLGLQLKSSERKVDALVVKRAKKPGK
jgi:uncharacterized protein (TIGR03435 family)